MKKHSIIYLLALFLFYGCIPDDGSDVIPASSGSFKIDDVSFNLSQGFFTDPIEESPSLFFNTILLSDSGLNSVNNGPLTGSGNAVVMEIYSATSSSNLLGTYTITDGSPVAGQAVVNYAVGLDLDNDTTDDEEDIESGTLTISRNNNGTFNVTLSNGRVDITGQSFEVLYDGTIKVVR